MDDTPPHIAQKMCEMIQLKLPIERFEMGCSMYETSRYLVIRSILEHNPHISEVELKQELFLKFYRDDFDPVQREKILKYLRDKNQGEAI
jgi:hypothetical protein